MQRFFFKFLFFFSIPLTTFCLLLAPTAAAAGEFSISYDNLYQVDSNFSLNVTQNVKITNLTTQYYAAQMTIAIGNVKVEKVTASDEQGPIPIEVNFAANQTTIGLKFAKPVVGKGQIKSLTLNYTSTELINKLGQILEVSIPKLKEAGDIDQFNVRLQVPTAAGAAAFITPEPKIADSSGFGGFYTYFFDKEQLLKSAIAASFGEKQVFSFNLTYHLANTQSVQTEIALPPDNNYQKVIIEKIEPEPVDVRIDEDGNWLAIYNLKAGKSQDIKVTGFVEVYPKPKFKIETPENLEKYLQPQKFWEANSEYFTQKATQFKTPKQIYDFVTSFLSYNQEKLTGVSIERIGAAAAVKNPKDAVCMEFTDLFITLSRAAGIPAREVNGFATSSNERLKPLSLRNLGGDVLHAWPEYWDDDNKTWVQIDPTWGATTGGIDYFSKMDFNHIAFVHKGLSSTYPVPAGGYKTDPSQSGDVKVEVTQISPLATFEPRLSIEMSKNIFSGFSKKGKILAKNSSNQAISLDPVKLTIENLVLKTPSEFDLGTLPPGAAREIDFEIATSGFLTNKEGVLRASWGPLTTQETIKIRPAAVLIIFAVLGSFIFATAVIFGSTFVYRKFLRTIPTSD